MDQAQIEELRRRREITATHAAQQQAAQHQEEEAAKLVHGQMVPVISSAVDQLNDQLGSDGIEFIVADNSSDGTIKVTLGGAAAGQGTPYARFTPKPTAVAWEMQNGMGARVSGDISINDVPGRIEQLLFFGLDSGQPAP